MTDRGDDRMTVMVSNEVFDRARRSDTQVIAPNEMRWQIMLGSIGRRSAIVG